MRSPSWLLAGGVVLLVGYIFIYKEYEAGPSAPPDDITASDGGIDTAKAIHVAVADQDKWVDRLVAGEDVEFRTQERDGGELVLGKFQTMGKLNERQLAEVVAATQSLLQDAQRAYTATARNAAAAGTADAFLEELHALRQIRNWEALCRQAERGRVWAFKGHNTAARLDAALPGKWVRTILGNVTTTEGGESIEVSIAVDPQEDEALRRLSKEIEDLQEFKIIEYVGDFNAQPYEVRSQKIALHKQATQALREGRPAGMSEAEWQARRKTLQADQITVNSRVDEATKQLIPISVR